MNLTKQLSVCVINVQMGPSVRTPTVGDLVYFREPETISTQMQVNLKKTSVFLLWPSISTTRAYSNEVNKAFKKYSSVWMSLKTPVCLV